MQRLKKKADAFIAEIDLTMGGSEPRSEVIDNGLIQARGAAFMLTRILANEEQIRLQRLTDLIRKKQAQ
jgi:hypothetical protein